MDKVVSKFLIEYPEVKLANLASIAAYFSLECSAGLALLNCQICEDATDDCVEHMEKSVGFLDTAIGESEVVRSVLCLRALF